MFSKSYAESVNNNCWFHPLVADIGCLVCSVTAPPTMPSGIQDLLTSVYPSLDAIMQPGPYPVSIRAPGVQMLGSGTLGKTRMRMLTNNRCTPLQKVHDHYSERFALSPEEGPRGTPRVSKLTNNYCTPLQTTYDHYCERFALSTVEPVHSRGLMPVLEESEDEDEDPIIGRQDRKPRAKELDDKAARLTDRAIWLEESANILKNDANRLKLKARRQRKAGGSSTPACSVQDSAAAEGPVTRSKAKDNHTQVHTTLRSLRSRRPRPTPVKYHE
ncbi:hypothetical protein BKA65DRAFT_473689 [Rhexocercosporidium sp. MPI-PUGE-AT-0058]|nr:hypothetical protein BKA65DRAFT_473689 [Rhexocercosporidium sp. MPI-PUGE-AT-0058]